MNVALRLAGTLLALAAAFTAPAAGGAEPARGVVRHGPFEIEAGVRTVPTGTFPNQGGNPFATKPLSEFQLRWRGQPVVTEGGQRSFWHVLRLPGAPRPALLLVTQGFVLASEDASGRLQLQALRSESASLAETQWLDARGGQPGPSEIYGFELVTDLQAGTRLEGGRWLRLGSRTVLDVGTLKAYPIEPWVPTPPGKPDTSLPRAGDHVRAFSPGRSQFVLAAAGVDYSSPDQRDAHGLLVVDMARGTAVELRLDRRRFRFAESDDIDAAWIDHHLSWQRAADGRERLVPRERFTPWPWRARLTVERDGEVTGLRVPRMDGRFLPVLRRLATAESGVRLVPDKDLRAPAFKMQFGPCVLEAGAYGDGSPFADDYFINVWAPERKAATRISGGCESALRRLATLIDAELATGAHDALLKLD